MTSRYGRSRRAALGAVAILNLHAAAALGQGAGREYRQVHLGMEVRLVLHAATPAIADSAARLAYARIAELEDVFSDWRPASEVRRLAEQPARWVPVSPELFDVLATALEISRLSGGAFDPTLGPVTLLWRRARETGVLPDSLALRDAMARTGWRHVTLDSSTCAARLDVAGMRIDLGGIAKGYILEAASRILTAHGVASHLIEAGGDLRVGSAPRGAAGWRVAVRSRARDTTITVANAAVATSGSTSQFVVIDGRRYSHLIDARTGIGLSHLRQVTVVAGDGALADAIATTMVILTPEEQHGIVSRFPDIRVFRTD